jgi:hypothetical protein
VAARSTLPSAEIWAEACALSSDEEFRRRGEQLRAAIDREGDLVAHRMSWLMTLNGFVVAGLAALVATKADFGDATRSWAAFFSLLALLGVASNAATLYSNMWAERAIQEADAAFMNIAVLGGLPPSPPEADRMRREHVVRAALRLAGRDPGNSPAYRDDCYAAGPWWEPIGKFLHPWFLLPLLFVAAYAGVPALGLVGLDQWYEKFGPQSTLLAVFVAIALGSRGGARGRE